MFIQIYELHILQPIISGILLTKYLLEQIGSLVDEESKTKVYLYEN